jgi:hypothetical protein
LFSSAAWRAFVSTEIGRRLPINILSIDNVRQTLHNRLRNHNLNQKSVTREYQKDQREQWFAQAVGGEYASHGSQIPLGPNPNPIML